MEKVAVYGAGVIGSGEAMLAIGHGVPCVVIGRSQEGLVRCRETIERHWDDLIDNGLATERNKAAAMKLLTITNDPAAMAGATLVFEAVWEDIEQKRVVFEQIEQYAAANVVIASCTSSLNAGDLAALTSRPENVVVAHPLQPVHMMPIVEIVAHDKSSDRTLQRLQDYLKQMDCEPIMLNRSITGFLVNRFQHALYRESIYLIEQGITTADDIDRMMKYLGMRYASMGLLEYYDDVGLPLESTISLNIYPDLCDAKTIQPSIQAHMERGENGLRAGRGLYDWSKKDQDDFRYRKQAPFLPRVKRWKMPE